MTASEAPAIEHLSYAVMARLRFIECVLAHYGTFNRSLIVDYFGLSVPQASIDISAYKMLAPNNMQYDPSAKLYRRCDSFKPVLP
jgi:hypothetical protein